jgi:hypothetical protein
MKILGVGTAQYRGQYRDENADRGTGDRCQIRTYDQVPHSTAMFQVIRARRGAGAHTRTPAHAHVRVCVQCEVPRYIAVPKIRIPLHPLPPIAPRWPP